MQVDSYLELFTTLFGWQFYGIIWDVLATTGIVYVPFIVMLVNNWRQARANSEYRSAWSISLRTMELDFYLALFVAMLSGPPALPLAASSMSFQPQPTIVDPTPPAATVASPQSTYGSGGAFSSAPGSVQVPVWWYAVITLSKGINQAILAGFPTEQGLRQIQQQAQLATISDAQLRAEASQFWYDCYIEARSRYLREKPSSATITSLLSTYGNDDVDWMGSHVYRATYYPYMRARRPVKGWLYDPARDIDYDPSAIHTWGQPTCEQWWADPTIGLREKILSESSVLDLNGDLIAVASALPSLTGVPVLGAATEKAKDWAVRAALDNARVNAMTSGHPDDLGVNEANGVFDGIYNAAADILGAVGSGYTHLETTAKTNILKTGLPMAQALILMSIYALLPFVVVFSRYSLGVMIGAAIALFAIHFWTVLWRLAAWVDENMLSAMFPGALDNLLYWLSSPEGIATSASKDLFFDIMLQSMFLGLPFVWTIVVGWAGVSIIGRLADLMPLSGTKAAGAAAGTGVKKGEEGARHIKKVMSRGK